MRMNLKAAVCAMCAVPAFALCSCGNDTSAPDKLPESFTVTAKIYDGNFEAEAKMYRTSDGWDITLTAPESLEGMNVNLTDADCRITYNELVYTADNDQLPENSPLRLTARALDKCVKSKPEGRLGDIEYGFTFKNGKPDELEIGSQIKVEFEKYKAK